MNYKQFRSPGEDIRVASTSGHVMIISKELRDVPEFLWADAYAAGAVSSDMKVESITSYVEEQKELLKAKEIEEREAIKAKMRTILAEPVTFLDSKDRLIQRKVVGLLGQPIKRDLMDEIWAEIIEEGVE